MSGKRPHGVKEEGAARAPFLRFAEPTPTPGRCSDASANRKFSPVTVSQCSADPLPLGPVLNLDLVERFIEEELNTRTLSFLPDPDGGESSYIESAELALAAVRESAEEFQAAKLDAQAALVLALDAQTSRQRLLKRHLLDVALAVAAGIAVGILITRMW